MSPDASEDRRAVFGLDLELEQKKIDKYSVEMEEEALQWIADLTGHAKDDHESVHNFLKVCVRQHFINYRANIILLAFIVIRTYYGWHLHRGTCTGTCEKEPW
jgi:hypothetical protein